MARFLVTNDDGIHGPGLHALARALDAAGHDVVVVAPDFDASGTSASLGRVNLREDLPVRRAELPGAPGVEAWALAGPPAMCVLAATLGGFGDDEIDGVVSGINAGANTGRAILHSGTVGAALTAQNFGYRGLAVSLAEHDDDYRWETAARMAAEVAGRLLEAPPRTTLNLNVPALPDGVTPPLRWARLASFGTVRSSMSGAEKGALQFELVAVDQELRADTDTAMIREGVATLTALGGVAEVWAGLPDGPADPADASDGGVTGPTGGLLVAAHPVPGDELSPAHLFPDPEVAAHLHPRRFD